MQDRFCFALVVRDRNWGATTRFSDGYHLCNFARGCPRVDAATQAKALGVNEGVVLSTDVLRDG